MENDYGNSQAKTQLESIKGMVAALNVDYDRLEELRDMTNYFIDGVPADQMDTADTRELAGLQEAAGECTSYDDACQRISEDPLSILVRSGWYQPGPSQECDLQPEEFEILLCTGGPAVRIIGDLINGQPDCPVLQYQSWGTPWTTYPTTMDEYETLLTYCERFYYGG